jgi:hypothetical protein
MLEFKTLEKPETSNAIIELLCDVFAHETLLDTCNFIHKCDEETLLEQMQKANIVSVWCFENGIEEVQKKSSLIETLAAANQIPTHVILGYHQCDIEPSASSLDGEWGPQYTASTIYPLSKETYDKLFDRWCHK